MPSLSDEMDELAKKVRDLEQRFRTETAVCLESTYSYYYSKGALDFRDKLLDEIQSQTHMDKGVQALIRSIVTSVYPDQYQFTTSEIGIE